MEVFIIVIKILLFLAGLLLIGVAFFGFLKYLKKTYFPSWTFLDYISVGYAEHLYKKFLEIFKR